MMMDTVLQQPTDSNGQTIVTPNERQALIQKLTSKWPLDLSTRIENQAFERSHGIKNNYIKFVQAYFQQVQTVLQNRANQEEQHQQIANNITYSNSQTNLLQQPATPVLNHTPRPLNQMYNQPSRFSVIQQPPRMNNPQPNTLNQMTRLREPQKFNPIPRNTLTYSPIPTSTTTTTIDLSQGYSSQQMNGTNPNDYSSLQPRYLNQPSMNVPRQRPPISNNNFPQQPTSNNTNDIVHQFIVGNSSSMPMSSSTSFSTTTTPTVNTTNSSTGDQLLQRILLSNIDGGSNKIPTQNRQVTPAVLSQPTRSASTMNSNMNNSTNPLRSSLSSEQLSPPPSVVIIPTPTETSTVQIQPSNNITIQQSPLSNSNGPYSANSQTVSTNSSTPVFVSNPSPTNRVLPLLGMGSILSPDNETLNLIKYLKENVNRLQLLTQKFTNEGNTEKLRQAQSIHQQILQFINNPTYETLANAKHFRDMLDRISNRAQPTNIPPTSTSQANIFNQCLKATNDFLLRDQKERINVTKRYLEPLTDVVNGVPHKMMRLDVDNYPTIKIRSSNESSLLSKLNEEINQIPDDIFSIERVSLSRTRQNLDSDEEDLNKNGIILRCKLFEKSNPIIPPLRLYITTSYPEQSPEILSLTKTMPPRLEFTDGHPFFDQVSSVFVSHLFKLRPQHTVTEILNIWRQSVHTAL